jgi:hypothetical protein
VHVRYWRLSTWADVSQSVTDVLQDHWILHHDSAWTKHSSEEQHIYIISPLTRYHMKMLIYSSL